MPYCFEYFDPIAEEVMFLEVVNTCTHHFTGEKMRYVRLHGLYGSAFCTYHFLNEKEWAEYLKYRIVEDAADSGDEQA